MPDPNNNTIDIPEDDSTDIEPYNPTHIDVLTNPGALDEAIEQFGGDVNKIRTILQHPTREQLIALELYARAVAAREQKVSRQSLLEELEDARELAMDKGRPDHAVKAIMGKAEILGYLENLTALAEPVSKAKTSNDDDNEDAILNAISSKSKDERDQLKQLAEAALSNSQYEH